MFTNNTTLYNAPLTCFFLLDAEKKQLLAQWRSSLIGLSKRDEALKEKENAIRNLQQELVVMDTEMNGYKNSTKIEQDKNESLTQILNKVRINEIGQVCPFARRLFSARSQG